MRRSLRIFVQQSKRVQVIEQHVSTEDKLVADSMSNGRELEAETPTKNKGQVNWSEDEGVMETWENYLDCRKWIENTGKKWRHDGTLLI